MVLRVESGDKGKRGRQGDRRQERKEGRCGDKERVRKEETETERGKEYRLTTSGPATLWDEFVENSIIFMTLYGTCAENRIGNE